jgi:hypothetical protein
MYRSDCLTGPDRLYTICPLEFRPCGVRVRPIMRTDYMALAVPLLGDSRLAARNQLSRSSTRGLD